jgi:hypothetical protein
MQFIFTVTYDPISPITNPIVITSDVDVHYNPDSLRLEFRLKVSNLDRFRLSMVLRWR